MTDKKFTVEAPDDYWLLNDANIKMLNLATYQSPDYGKQCSLVSRILQQIMEQIKSNKGESI